MKNVSIGLFILSIFVIGKIDAKQPNNQKSIPRKIVIPQKSTLEQDNHNVKVEERPLDRHEHITPSVDKKVEQEPDGTVIETITTTDVQDNKVVTTTQTWTWKDYAKIAAGVGLATLAGAAAYNSYYNATPAMPENNLNLDTNLQNNTVLSTPSSTPISQPFGQNIASSPQASAVSNTINQQTKRSFLEKGLERYLDNVAANPDLDNQMAGDNYIAPDEFDAMAIHPVTEAMMLPFDVKDRLAIAAQNIQDPHFKFGRSLDASLEKIHELNAQEGYAYIKADEGDQSLGHTVSNLGIARMYAPAYRGISGMKGAKDAIMLQGPRMSSEINYAQQAKQAFLARNNPTTNQLLLPAPANGATQASKAVTTGTPVQQQAMTNVMKTNPNQFTTAIRTQTGSNVPINQQQASTLSHAGMLPIESPQAHSAIRTQTGSNFAPRSDNTLIKTTEVVGHTAFEAPKFNPNLNPSLQAQPWTPSGNYFPAQ
jgi:hypothetical protein